MKIDPLIKEFLDNEHIQDLINDGDINRVFDIFVSETIPNNSRMGLEGQLIQQLYKLIKSTGIKWEEKYITKLFEFVSQTIGRKVEYEGKQGTIFGYTFLNYNQHKNYLWNFNNMVLVVVSNNSKDTIIALGNEVKLLD